MCIILVIIKFEIEYYLNYNKNQVKDYETVIELINGVLK